MDLANFLSTFIGLLNKAEIAHCILRNYEGLPLKNPGNDIDFLFEPKNIEPALTILSNIDKVTVTGLIRRPYVVSIFIHGVDWDEDRRHAIELDLISLIGWKGLSYLSVNEVLEDAQKIPSSGGLLKRPASYHEALISFFSSYLVGGWIKSKYQVMVREIFCKEKQKLLSLLCDIMPKKVATTLVDAVIKDNRNCIFSLLPTIKRHLLLTRLFHSPYHSLKAIFIHYFTELKIRFTPYPIDTICFLGPDGSGKSSAISRIICKLKDTTKVIACYHLKPSLYKKNGTPLIVTAPHAKPPRSAIFSAGKIISWLFLYWLDRFLHGHKNLTLKIWDRYYYDLLIDPKRYRYGAPMWFARMVGKFIPVPDLVILLDAPPEVLQRRKQEVPFEETARQRDAYLQYIQGLENGVVIDASQPLPQVAQSTNDVILSFLEKRAERRFKNYL